MSEPSFHELGLSEPVSQALAKRDIHAPFEIQSLVLRDAIAGLDILAKSPTGSGKTLAFALPIVERLSADDPRPSALVLVPTRELAVQVTAEFASIAPARGLQRRLRLRRRQHAHAGRRPPRPPTSSLPRPAACPTSSSSA